MLLRHLVRNACLPMITLIGAVLTVLGNLLADVALTIVDPRIRLS